MTKSITVNGAAKTVEDAITVPQLVALAFPTRKVKEVDPASCVITRNGGGTVRGVVEMDVAIYPAASEAFTVVDNDDTANSAA